MAKLHQAVLRLSYDLGRESARFRRRLRSHVDSVGLIAGLWWEIKGLRALLTRCAPIGDEGDSMHVPRRGKVVRHRVLLRRPVVPKGQGML